MLQFNIPDKQYTLSLDALDLCFLSQYLEKSDNENKVLWSQNASKEPVYYKVELAYEELQINDYFIETCDNYKCYICNMDVPLKYYKQHNKSQIHKNCKMLAEKILENVTKQMNVDLDDIRYDVDYTTFYCEYCCKVVERKQERKHKSSNYHLKSCENAQLISKFLDAYTNDANNMQIYKSKTNREGILDLECNNESDSGWPNASDSDEDFVTNEKLNQNNADTNHSTELLNPKDLNNLSVPSSRHMDIESLQEDFIEVIKRKNLQCAFHTIEENSVIIVVPKENVVEISDDFHEERTEEHLSTVNADKDCVRNHSQQSDIKIPEEPIDTPTGANSSRSTKDLIYSENQLSTDPDCNTPSVSNSECSESKIEIEEPSSTTNDISIYHSPKDNKIVEENRKIIAYNKQFSTLDGTRVNCLVCSVPVPFRKKNIIEHVEGRNHTDATAILLKNNYIEKKSIRCYLCHVCNRYTMDFVKHIKNDQSHLQELDNGNISRKLLKQYVHDDPDNQSSIAIHCRAQYNSLIQEHNIFEVDSSLYCFTCIKKISPKSEIDHVFSEHHRNSANKCSIT